MRIVSTVASLAFAVTIAPGHSRSTAVRAVMILAVLAGWNRLVDVVADQDPAGAGVDDDVGLGRGEPRSRRRTRRGDHGDHDRGRAGKRGEAAGRRMALKRRRYLFPGDGSRRKRLGLVRARRATMESCQLRVSHLGSHRRHPGVRDLAVDAKAKALKAAGENVIGFGAASPTSRHPRTSWRRRSRHAATPATTTTRRLRVCPSCARRLRSRPSATPASMLRCAVWSRTVASTAVYNTFQALCNDGDEVLVPAPYWTSYPEVITLAGGVPVVLVTSEADGFRVTIDQLDAACTSRTKALLFVSPSNPTGAVYPPEAVEAIGRWALERGIWVVTDEIYEHLTYDGHVFSSMPGLVPELLESLRDRERRREDLRHDRLARRMDDRAPRRDHRRDQPAVAFDLERLERRAGRHARRGERRPVSRSRDAGRHSRDAATRCTSSCRRSKV